MKKTLLAALMGAMVMAPLAAKAEGHYVKLNIGQSNFSDLGPLSDIDATAFSIAYGYQLDKTWAVEGGYLNTGRASMSASDGTASASLGLRTQSLFLAGVGALPLNEAFSVYGKLGLAINRSSGASSVAGTGTVLDGASSGKTTKASPLLGIGVAYQITPEWQASVDYSYLHEVTDGSAKLSMWSAGLRYNF